MESKGFNLFLSNPVQARICHNYVTDNAFRCLQQMPPLWPVYNISDVNYCIGGFNACLYQTKQYVTLCNIFVGSLPWFDSISNTVSVIMNSLLCTCAMSPDWLTTVVDSSVTSQCEQLRQELTLVTAERDRLSQQIRHDAGLLDSKVTAARDRVGQW